MNCQFRAIFCGLLCCLLQSGCALSPPVITCEQLNTLAKDYSRQLRWRETDQALKLIDPAPDGPRTAWVDALKQIEVIDCSVKEIICTPDSVLAKSLLSLSYLRAGSATLQNKDLLVEWRKMPTTGWSLISAPPTFK